MEDIHSQVSEMGKRYW